MASKRRMMTLNAFSLYGALGNESSTSSSTSSSTPLLPPPSATSSSSGDGDGEPSSSKRPRNDGDSSSPPPTTTTTTNEQFLGGKSHANGIAPIRNDTEDRSGSGENDSASNQAPPSTTSGKGVEMAKMLRSVCGWRKGEREEMQDAHVLEDQFGLCATDIKTSAFYAIFDGHAGRRASQFCSQRIPSMVKDKLSACKSISEMENAMKRIFVECYRQVDEQFLAQARRVRPTWKDGTTATTVIILNSIVYCANIGDSRAVVCRKKSDGSVVALQLTVDHSPLQFEERMRIQRAGGTVKDGRILGVLEVSRSIGDGQFKAHGVTCLPDVKKFSITQEDRFILIACDGLWKTFSNQEAIEFVLQKSKQTIQAEKSSKEESSSLVDSRYSTWEQTAGEIAAESVRRGCGDNVSVIIVVLDDSAE